jgi:iron(III) transport system ATP-binding protein
MSYIQLHSITKRYDSFEAVSQANLEIEKGSFVTLLGPSGCGKTTTLRMIAGLIRPTAGEISIDGRILSSADTFVPPEERKLGMVFQSYAVWPHMNVFDNVAYPLKKQKKSKEEIRRVVREVLQMVRLDGFDRRMPFELSGGLQQRVALARALAMRPLGLLLDEPLSNLDAKLREEMRFEIKDIQRKIQITIVYVTHDLGEAMTMSDKIVVMKNGRILQSGSPEDIYFTPDSQKVAEFIGRNNFINAVVDMVNGQKTLNTDCGIIQEFVGLENFKLRQDVLISVKSEDINMTPDENGTFTVKNRAFVGDHTDYELICGDLIINSSQTAVQRLNVGDRVSISLKHCTIFGQ